MIWYLILATSSTVLPPIPYANKDACNRAGQVWVENMNRLSVWYKCIPNDAAALEGKDD
jgi:hypothetical protein